MRDDISPADRAEIAASVGLNPRYLYQCLTGRRDMDARQAVELETASGGRVRRWHVRRDWARVWPELVGVDGAPCAVVRHVE